jgi:hypothetical protein
MRIKSKRYRLLQKPSSPKDLADYFYDLAETDTNWEDKARRLQARRWRLLKNQSI